MKKRCDRTLVDITEQGTATQERRQAYRDQAEAPSYTRQLRLEFIEPRIGLLGLDFSILEDDRSVNRGSISFAYIQKI